MRSVQSIGMPTCNGADEAKKNPPREILMASVKCSLLSEARLIARKRREVRMLWRAALPRFLLLTFFSPPGKETNPPVPGGIFYPQKTPPPGKVKKKKTHFL